MANKFYKVHLLFPKTQLTFTIFYFYNIYLFSDIWVLATDYDTYALLYSCENVGTEYRRGKYLHNKKNEKNYKVCYKKLVLK